MMSRLERRFGISIDSLGISICTLGRNIAICFGTTLELHQIWPLDPLLYQNTGREGERGSGKRKVMDGKRGGRERGQGGGKGPADPPGEAEKDRRTPPGGPPGEGGY